MQPSAPSPNSSWHQWWQTEGPVFFLYARQQTRCEADAKDVLQDSLIESWRKSSNHLPDKAMVFATIRRRAIDLGRSIDRRQRREEEVANNQTGWFHPTFGDTDLHDHMTRVIAKLPPDLREVLILRIWGDMTFPAIAQMTEIPVATATSRYRYAIERLRENLTESQL